MQKYKKKEDCEKNFIGQGGEKGAKRTNFLLKHLLERG